MERNGKHNLSGPVSGDSLISVIIVSYFTGPLLSRCVESLTVQPEIGEIIVVDNGNLPDEIENAKPPKNWNGVFIVKSDHGNIGFAAGCNLGAGAATLPYLLFLNPDAVMPPNGVRQLLSDGKGLEQPWLMGVKLVDQDGKEQQGSRRDVLTPWRAFIEGTKLYRLAPQHPYFSRFNLHTDDCPEEICTVPTISGACMFLPQEDYFLIGGMDEGYFLHVEDVDFCLRFGREGGDVFFNPHIDLLHYKSSSRANAWRIELRKTKSMIRYFNMHFADAYPKPFLWMVYGLLWLSLGILAAKRAIVRIATFAILRFRYGRQGVARAQAMMRNKARR